MEYRMIDLIVVSENGKHINWDATNTRIMDAIIKQNPDARWSEQAMLAVKIEEKCRKFVKRVGVRVSIKILKGEM